MPSRRLRFAVCLWVALAARAQIGGLVTTDDGSALYFATSLRLKGTTEPASSKIFVADSGGIRLFADRPPNPDAEYVNLVSPDVSGDGSLIAYSGTYATNRKVCGAAICVWLWDHDNYRTWIQGLGSGFLVGRLHLSANGRYAIGSGPTGAGAVFLDLSSGETTTLPPLGPYQTSPFDLYMGHRIVASDGTAALSDGGTLYLWRKDLGVRQIPLSNVGAIIDDAATKVVYFVPHYNVGSTTATLYSLDLATGSAKILANGSAPSMSRDGRRIAFLSPVNGVLQAYTVRYDGDELRQVTDDPAGLTSVTISGDGNILYATTPQSRILKIDLAAGTTTELLPPVAIPSLVDPYAAVVPGSQQVLMASGLVPDTLTAMPPLPFDLGGIRVLVNGTPAPLFSVSPTDVRYQVPWETVSGASVVVDVPGAVFESPITLPLLPFAPVFETQSCNPAGYDCVVSAAHADSAAPVTADNPARSGEAIDLYLHGLGAVFPLPANGVAAPDSPPSVVQHPMACWLDQFSLPPPPPQSQIMPILSAKLAPGMVGIYVVRVQFAPQIAFAKSSIRCASPDQFGGNATGFIYTARNM